MLAADPAKSLFAGVLVIHDDHGASIRYFVPIDPAGDTERLILACLNEIFELGFGRGRMKAGRPAACGLVRRKTLQVGSQLRLHDFGAEVQADVLLFTDLSKDFFERGADRPPAFGRPASDGAVDNCAL